jgi:hypothetical protein
MDAWPDAKASIAEPVPCKYIYKCGSAQAPPFLIVSPVLAYPDLPNAFLLNLYPMARSEQ